MLNSGPVNINNDISVYTSNTPNGTMSVLSNNKSCTYIIAGNDVISISCALSRYQMKSATLMIKGISL